MTRPGKFNFLKLRRLIEDNGLDNNELARMVGMGESTLSKRLSRDEHNGTWNWEEINGICRALHIPQEQIGAYFFPKMEKGESA